MTERKKCYICGLNATVIPSQYFVGDFITCPRCGKVIIEESAFPYIKGEEGYKYISSLFYYFMHYKKSNEKTYLIVEDEVKNDKYNIISIQEIINVYPKTFSEKLDKVLLSWNNIHNPDSVYINFSDLLADYYKMFFIKYDPFMENRANTYIEIVKQIEYLLHIMWEQGLVKKKNSDNYYALDYKGWKRIDELQKQFQTKNQGFIAMWFHPSMNEIEVAIKEAITESGYLSMIISDKEHNNQIVPEILYEIKSSDFVVADLTENRGGVYYEAGYAFGLGKEVIVTVDETKIEPHFDVAQKNQVRYKTPEELKVRLKKRIIATVGSGDSV